MTYIEQSNNNLLKAALELNKQLANKRSWYDDVLNTIKET